MVIYFIFNKSFCQLCHKTFSSNRSLKINIGRNHEALRCILNGISKKITSVRLFIVLGVTHKYKNQKKSEISDLGGEGGGEGVRRAENF